MWFLLLWVLGILTSIVTYWITGVPDKHYLYSVLLLDQFVVTFGLLGIIGFLTNVILAKPMAKKLNWPGGPFQVKYGFAQLCIGIMGVMAIWFRGSYWVATLINMYMYGLSGFWTHTQEMIENHKPDTSNVCNLIMNLSYQVFITI